MSTFDLVANSNVTKLKTEIEFNIKSIEKEFNFEKEELILEKEFFTNEYFGYTGKILISDRMEYREGSTVRKKRVSKIEFVFSDIQTTNMEIDFGEIRVNHIGPFYMCSNHKDRRWCVDAASLIKKKKRIESVSGKLSISFEPLIGSKFGRLFKERFNTPLDLNRYRSKSIKNAKDFKIIRQEQNLKTEIEFSLNLIEDEFSYENNELILEKKFFTNEDLGYLGKIIISDWMKRKLDYRYYRYEDIRVCKIEFIFPETSNVAVTGKLCVNKTEIKHNFFCNAQNVWCLIFTDQMKNKKIESMSGKLSISFNPSFGRLLRAKFNTSLNFNPIKPIQNTKDFQIICQQPHVFGPGWSFGGKAPKNVFEFSKSVLIKTSPVFQTMLDRPEYMEAQKSLIKMVDTTPEVLEAFHNVLFGTSIEEEMFSVGLLRFAHKYEMDVLYEMCQDFLCKQLDKFQDSDKDNKRDDFILEVLEVANLFEDEKIWSKALECMKRNFGSIDYELFRYYCESQGMFVNE